jgi:hypothetical protein
VATLEELVVSLVAETSGLRAELNNAAKVTKDVSSKMDKSIEEFTKSSSKNLSFFETSMATMTGFLASEAVLGVFGLVKDAVGFLSDSLKEGAEDAIAEENALKRLANSLALSGQYTEDAMLSLQNFTGRMEELTGVEDHTIASNLALLSSLTKLDAEGLQRAEEAALNMSVALGMDLESATRLIGKGIEGNTEAFKRYGLTITEGSTKAETMARVLGTLESKFGGAAAGAAQTFGGALKGLTNAWGNLNEALATAVTKNPVVLSMMQEMTKIVNQLTGSAQTAGDIFQKVLGGALLAVNEILFSFAKVLDDIFSAFGSDKFKGITKALDDIGNAGADGFNKIGEAAEATTPTIVNQKKAVDELGTSQKTLLTAFATGLAEQGMALDNFYAYNDAARQANLELELVQLEEHNLNKYDLLTQDLIARDELLTTQQEKEFADLATAHANGIGTETQYQAAKTALAQKHYLENKKLELDKQKFQADMQKATLQGYGTLFEGLSVLQQSSSKELAAIGKAAAITNATINAYLAITNALATVPYPANIAASIGIGIMAFANVAKIAGIGLNKGGTISGGGANVDTVAASLTKGETVVTRDVTDKLENFLNNPQSGGGGNIRIELSLKDSLVEFIEAKIIERQATNVSLIGAV